MTDLNYFVCTLGQAALLKERGDQRASAFPTVLDLVDKQAARIPERPALGFANYGKARGTHEGFPNQITFSDLNNLSVNAAATLKGVLGLLGHEANTGPVTIGLLCNSSLDFVLTWLGLMRLRCRAFLLGPQLEPQAIIHLCKGTNVGIILVDDAHAQKGTELPYTLNIVKIPSYRTDPTSIVDAYRQRQLTSSETIATAPSTDNIAYLRHTSGTSSGLPKPILQSQWGAVGALPVFTEEHQPATFSTTPLYHGGLADCFRAWTSGAMIWLFPEGTVPITGSNIINAVEYTRKNSDPAVVPVKYFSSVPYVLQMLAEEGDAGIELLQSMDLVGVGGAALAPSLGDKLVSFDVNLVSRIGSAECGFLMSSHRDYARDKEWQYFRPMDDEPSFIAFKPRENGLSELVVGPRWPLRSKTNRPDGSYATSDLFELHPSRENAWRYHSRSDAQITLANGKKFDPSPLEDAIRASTPIVRDVLVFGVGRDYAGALLFASSGDISGKDVIEAVWPTIQRLNNESQSHSRLTRNMLVVLDASDGHEGSLPKSSKGTILRHQAEERYAEEIEHAYSGKPDVDGGEQISDEDLLGVITRIFSEVLGREDVHPEQDLYHQGVDSIACIQVRKRIESAGVLPPNSSALPLNVIYDNGNIRALSDYLMRLRQGRDSNSMGMQPADGGDLELMRNWVEQYGAFESAEDKKPPHPKDGVVVVLTGATGLLGAHILSQLQEAPHVRRIYCLLRGETPFAARERVAKALWKRKLTERDVTATTLDDKVVCLPCNLSDPRLGLADGDWARVTGEATHFIHSAWAVNFSLRLRSFEASIRGTRHLVDAASAAAADFVFISSTASVSSSSSSSSSSAAPIVPENISLNPEDASPLGYARSKWVAEHICARYCDFTTAKAARPAGEENLKGEKRSPSVSVVRVGQLCGNQHGVWNASEAYPLMLSTARITGCLPDLPNQPLNWLPVDVASRAVLEIALRSSQEGSSGRRASIGSSDGADNIHIPVFHVLNFHKTPTWRTMLDWILESAAAAASSFEARNVPFKIVSPSRWVKRLEEVLLDESVESDGEAKHPSQALLGQWKDRYLDDNDESATPSTSSTIKPAAPEGDEMEESQRFGETTVIITPGADAGGGTTPPTFGITSTLRTSLVMRDVKQLDRASVLKMWDWIQESC